jgi:hypothetical protein
MQQQFPKRATHNPLPAVYAPGDSPVFSCNCACSAQVKGGQMLVSWAAELRAVVTHSTQPAAGSSAQQAALALEKAGWCAELGVAEGAPPEVVR